jgi:hypothetical protein
LVYVYYYYNVGKKYKSLQSKYDLFKNSFSMPILIIGREDIGVKGDLAGESRDS